MNQNRSPLSKVYTEIDRVDLFKDEKWWSSVVLFTGFGGKRKQIGMYLWVKKDGAWKRRAKFVVKSRREWLLLRDALDRFVLQLN